MLGLGTLYIYIYNANSEDFILSWHLVVQFGVKPFIFLNSQVSIPLDALESFWMEGYQRETWGMKIQTSSSIEDLLQVLNIFLA